MKKIFYLIPLLISCHNTKIVNKDESKCYTIDLSNYEYSKNSLNLSEIATFIDYVPFETRENSLITEGAHFKASKNYYLIGQKGQIIQFDLTGKFIRNLVKLGRGPGEGFSRCFEIDRDSDILYMYNNFIHNIDVYDLKTGKNINRIKDPEINFSTGNIFYYKKYLTLIAINSSKEYFFKSYHTLTLKNTLKWPIKYKTDKTSLNSIAEYSSAYFQNYNDTMLFKEMFCDTIYQTTDCRNIQPRYILEGDNNLSYEEYQEFLSSPNKARIKNRLIIGRFFETLNNLFIYSYDGGKSNLLILNKKDHILKKYDTMELKNDIDGGVNVKINWNPQSIIYSDNRLYCLLDPLIIKKNIESTRIKSNKFTCILNRIDEFDNPILMIITLKK